MNFPHFPSLQRILLDQKLNSGFLAVWMLLPESIPWPMSVQSCLWSCRIGELFTQSIEAGYLIKFEGVHIPKQFMRAHVLGGVLGDIGNIKRDCYIRKIKFDNLKYFTDYTNFQTAVCIHKLMNREKKKLLSTLWEQTGYVFVSTAKFTQLPWIISSGFTETAVVIIIGCNWCLK